MLPTLIQLPEDSLITAQELARYLKVSQRTIWRWVEVGRLPQPIRYSRRCVRWRADYLRAHLDGYLGKAARSSPAG